MIIQGYILNIAIDSYVYLQIHNFWHDKQSLFPDLKKSFQKLELVIHNKLHTIATSVFKSLLFLT